MQLVIIWKPTLESTKGEAEPLAAFQGPKVDRGCLDIEVSGKGEESWKKMRADTEGMIRSLVMAAEEVRKGMRIAFVRPVQKFLDECVRKFNSKSSSRENDVKEKEDDDGAAEEPARKGMRNRMMKRKRIDKEKAEGRQLCSR